MINLYIDTNAYLSFYHLASDDLEELHKLQVLIENGEIVLHLPQQTHDEFRRNREAKIADALKRFKEDKFTNQFPQMSKQYPEFKAMKKSLKEFEINKSKLLEKLNRDIVGNDLAADKIITALFEDANCHHTTSTILKMATCIRYTE